MSKDEQRIKIVVLGDGDLQSEFVGKSSLIKTYVSDSFPDFAPSVNPPVIIPQELYNTLSTLVIIDTQYRRDNPDKNIGKDIKKADVIIVMYDVSNEASLTNAIEYWIPGVESFSDVPVILVGGKADLYRQTQEIEEIMQDVSQRYQNCQIGLEFSSKDIQTVKTLFSLAEKIALYPTRQLYNPIKANLTPKFLRALHTIFRYYDTDLDGYLQKEDLSRLNQEVYKTDISEMTIKKIDEMTDGNMIQGQVKLFKMRARDGVIKQGDIDKIVYSSKYPPQSNNKQDWRLISKFIQCQGNFIDINGWLSFWQLMINLKTEQTIKAIKLMGFRENYLEIFRITEERNIYKVSNRKVFKVSITGHQGVGKSSLLRSFVNKDPRTSPELRSQIVCGVIEEKEQIEDNIYLIMESKQPNDDLSESDIICLLYDGSQVSQESLFQIPKLPQSIPKVLILNKQELQGQENFKKIAKDLEIHHFIQMSIQNNRPDSLFRLLRDLSIHPYRGFPPSEDFEEDQQKNYTKLIIAISIGLGCLFILGYKS